MYSKLLIENINRNLFVTADPQFGSRGVFDHVPARKIFRSIHKLHRTLVDNWNSAIDGEDVVLCLGDFTQNLKHKHKSMSLVEKYSGLLTGKKILIRGNHDAEDTSWYYDCGWNCLIEYPLIIQNRTMNWLTAPTRYCGCIICDIGDRRILFSHFAIYENDDDDCRYPVEKAFLRELFVRYHCDLNVHGHTHHRVVEHPDCLSACVEQTLFTPVRVRQLLAERIEMPAKKIA